MAFGLEPPAFYYILYLPKSTVNSYIAHQPIRLHNIIRNAGQHWPISAALFYYLILMYARVVFG